MNVCTRNVILRIANSITNCHHTVHSTVAHEVSQKSLQLLLELPHVFVKTELPQFKDIAWLLNIGVSYKNKGYRVCGLVSCGLGCAEGKAMNLFVYMFKVHRFLNMYF